MTVLPAGMSSTGNPVRVDAIARALSDAAATGATVLPSGQPYVGSGIVVAVEDSDLYGDIFDWIEEDYPQRRIHDWVESVSGLVANAQTLRQRAFGIWVNEVTHAVYLDVVEIFSDDDEAEAVAAGRARDQIAIWHNGRKETIDTGGEGAMAPAGRPS